MIRVVLVDDHKVVQRGLRSYLEAFDDIVIIGMAVSGEELLTHLAHWEPDVIVMDLLMPGGIDGIETTRRVKEQSPETHVVVLTANIDESRVLGAIRVGASGYIRKDADPEFLLMAVRSAAKGQTVLDPAIAHAVIMEKSDIPDLTDREIDILQLLAHGLTNGQIATQLTISEETVKTHVGNLLGKFGYSHRLQVVVMALKMGIINLDDIDLT